MATCVSHGGVRRDCLLLLLPLVFVAYVTLSVSAASAPTTEGADPPVTETLPQRAWNPLAAVADPETLPRDVRIAGEEATVQQLLKSSSKVHGGPSHRNGSRRRWVPSVVLQKKVQLRLAALIAAAVLGMVATLVQIRCSRYFAEKRETTAQGNKPRRLAGRPDDLTLLCEPNRRGPKNGRIYNPGVNSTQGGVSLTRTSSVPSDQEFYLTVLSTIERGQEGRMLEVARLEQRERNIKKIIKAIVVLGISAVVLYVLALLFNQSAPLGAPVGTFLDASECMFNTNSQQAFVDFAHGNPPSSFYLIVARLLSGPHLRSTTAGAAALQGEGQQEKQGDVAAQRGHSKTA